MAPVTRTVKWIVRTVVVLAALYAVLFSAVLVAMLRPPDQFGLVMKYVPPALVWGLLPGPRMWLWARSGTLAQGDIAPDFTLSTADHQSRVTLSSHRRQRPVVLVFGSYT
jgi:hypothetical protein